MPTYEQLRADVASLVATPGHITRAEVQAVLERNPPPPPPSVDVFDDAVFDPAVFG